MDARPAAITRHVNPSESIHPKTPTHLTPLESHSCTQAQCKSFKITSLRKNRGGGHSVNQLPETETAPLPVLSLPRYFVTSLPRCFFTSFPQPGSPTVRIFASLPHCFFTSAFIATLIPSHSIRGLTNVSRHAVPCYRGAGPRRLPAHRKPRSQSASHSRRRPHRHRYHWQ